MGGGLSINPVIKIFNGGDDKSVNPPSNTSSNQQANANLMKEGNSQIAGSVIDNAVPNIRSNGDSNDGPSLGKIDFSKGLKIRKM